MNTEIPLDHTPAPGRGEDESLRRRTGPRTVTSEELFRGATELTIEHAGSLYRLKITRQGKLILNK
ncbi:hemin uptake protein HemP [Chelativorans sp. YIM 93263]|uniref:hemin uptake protein HemP n=1 Tax=Chelativorans sp. YIM 93263 TaxID=2906648 RepID=UPI00403E1084